MSLSFALTDYTGLHTLTVWQYEDSALKQAMAWQASGLCWCIATFWHSNPATASHWVILCNCMLHWVKSIKMCIPVVYQSNAWRWFGSHLLSASSICVLSVMQRWPVKRTECGVVFTQADNCCPRLVQCGVWWSASTHYQHTLGLRPCNTECWHDSCQEQPGTCTAGSARQSSCSCLLSIDPGRPYREVWQETAKPQVVWCVWVLMGGRKTWCSVQTHKLNFG